MIQRREITYKPFKVDDLYFIRLYSFSVILIIGMFFYHGLRNFSHVPDMHVFTDE